MAPRMIDFYFDFVSPFSYLAHSRLHGIAGRFGYGIRYKVVELKRLKLLAGNTSPPTRDIPLKLRYMRIDQQRWARRYGVTLAPPRVYGPDRLNRGVFFADWRGQTRDYVTRIYHEVWGVGGDMTDEGMMRDVAGSLGWDAKAFLADTDSGETERRYSAATEDAHERGIFGVPMMMIEDEMWWGNDRLDFMEEFLKSGGSASTKP
jgi:2-hydroxychromene-2-carboxylate isomerase